MQRQHIDSFSTFQKLLNVQDLTTYERLLYIALTVSAEGKTECDPTIKTLARLCGCCPHQVMQTLKSLEAKKFITKIAQYIEAENNAQTANKYILQFGR
jgi:DNA-binding MarR family transcriptional regulator